MWPFKKKIEVKKTSSDVSIQCLFIESIQEAADETLQKERNFLTDDLLKKYFKNVIKNIVTKNVISDDDVWMTSYDSDVPDDVWDSFKKIFIKVCAELNIKSSTHKAYLLINKSSFDDALKEMKVPQIDIEERMNSMLRLGPYR